MSVWGVRKGVADTTPLPVDRQARMCYATKRQSKATPDLITEDPLGVSYRDELRKAAKKARARVPSRAYRGKPEAEARSKAIKRQQSRMALHWGKEKATQRRLDAD